LGVINYFEPGRSIAIITDEASASVQFGDAVEASAESAGNLIDTRITVEEDESLSSAVTEVKECGATIFAVKFDTRTAEFFKEARVQGITGPGYQYFVTDQFIGADSYTIGELTSSLFLSFERRVG